jgi:hypothetical protein
MKSLLYVSPGDTNTRDDTPPEDVGRGGVVSLRSHRLLALAFGFALGLTFVLLFFFFRIFGAPTADLQAFVSQINPNVWWSFLCGFVGGTVLAAVYNLLVVHHLNLFGLDSKAD